MNTSSEIWVPVGRGLIASQALGAIQLIRPFVKAEQRAFERPRVQQSRKSLAGQPDPRNSELKAVNTKAIDSFFRSVDRRRCIIADYDVQTRARVIEARKFNHI